MSRFVKFVSGILLVFYILNIPAYADNLGRLFTNENERVRLDRIRNTKPVEKPVEKPVVVEQIIEPEKEKKEVIVGDEITLKGIVYRENGRSTAWINDSNTTEGDLESQYIKVDGQDISSDEVQVTMPDNTTRVKLKVGEKFIPVVDPEN